MSHPDIPKVQRTENANYWAARMDNAMNRDDFMMAWDKWWQYAIEPHAKRSTARSTS